MFDGETEKQVYSLVEVAVENENFFKYVMKLRSIWNNGAVDFIRVGIFGRDHNNFYKNMDLIVKVIRTDRAVKMGLLRSLRRAFRREIFLYRNVFPMMDIFLRKKSARNPFEPTLVVCYQTLETDDGELAVIFNDLKKLKFSHMDSKKPMGLKHLKAVLARYARFHAICFALRDQNDEFEKLLRDFDSVDKDTFSEGKITDIIGRGIARATEVLNKRNQHDLKQKFEKFSGRGISRILEDVLSNIPEEWVIVHGDGWNENFVFRCEDDESLPDLCILNWQFSTPHSPVLDISLFLYFVSSKEELLQFETIIKFYYDHFCHVLSSLGSDPQKLFPFSKLMEHWRTFTSYALLLVAAGLPGICASTPGTFSTVQEENMYGDRISAVIEHYFSLADDPFT